MSNATFAHLPQPQFTAPAAQALQMGPANHHRTSLPRGRLRWARVGCAARSYKRTAPHSSDSTFAATYRSLSVAA